MSPTIGLPPPRAEAILDASRASRYKGGTLIAEEVQTVAEHLIRMANADLYRPASCARCGHARLHVHDRVERRPRGDATLPRTMEVLIFACASAACGATWRILPRFLARQLWHSWRAVELAVKPPPTSAEAACPGEPPSAHSTQRWRSRLASAGLCLRMLLVMAGQVFAEIGACVPQVCTREQVLDAFVAEVEPRPRERLSAFAAVLDRLERGVRLM